MNKKYLALLDEGWKLGDNAFADLGFDDAEHLDAKAYLRAAILSRIKTLDVSQVEAARLVGLPQPKMSNLMSDTARGFSSDKLMDVAVKLGLNVTIRVSPSRTKVGRVKIGGTGPRSRSSKLPKS